MRIDKLILVAWLVFLVSFIIPWTAKPFGGWLLGWFWIMLDVVPAFTLVEKFSLAGLSGLLSFLAMLIMLASPLYIYFLKNGFDGFYKHLPLIAFVFALLSSSYRIYYFSSKHPPVDGLYILGNAVWVVSFGLLWKGFKQQLDYIKSHFLKA